MAVTTPGDSSMNIDNNCVVTLQFDLTDNEGNNIHSTTADEPMVVVHDMPLLKNSVAIEMMYEAVG